MENKEDLYVIGFPKSGNTWLARLLSDITNSKIYIESEKDKINSSENSDDKNGKYLIHKIHATDDLNEVLKAKKIYILRDPRAVIVSGFFHHYRNISENKIKNSRLVKLIFNYEIERLNQFWSGSLYARVQYFYITIYRFIFNKKNIYEVSWSEHIKYWSSLNDIAIVRYEDLVENTFIELKRILDELGIAYRDEELKIVIEHQSFSKKKKEFLEKGDLENLKFLRSGEKDSWRKLLTLKLQKKIEIKHQEMMKKFGYQTETID